VKAGDNGLLFAPDNQGLCDRLSFLSSLFYAWHCLGQNLLMYPLVDLWYLIK
jgi:hypothetical protein